MPDWRDTGIPAFGDRPWGAHLCHLYQSDKIREDLIAVVVPYLRAGLAAGEFCLWSVAPPVTPEEARVSLGRLVPNVEDHIQAGRLEIVSHREWIVGDGPFESDQAIGILTNKLNRALAVGHPGMRFATMRSWVAAKDRKTFVSHEELLDATMASRPVLGLCSYDADRCCAIDMPEILAPHCAVLVKYDADWKCCEPAVLRRTAHLLNDSQTQLLESKSKYQTLLENIPQRVFYKDVNSVFVTVNTSFANDLGLQPGDLVGRTDYDFFSKDLAEKYRQDDRRILESGVAEQYEEGYVAEGRRIVVETTKAPVRDARGNVLGILGVFADITDRKRADEERAFQAALIQARSETSPDGILFVDNRMRPQPLNKRFAEMWDVPAEILSLANEPALVEHVANQVRNRTAFLDRVAYFYANPEAKGYDEFELKDGRVYERYTYPLFGAGGEHFGRIWYFRDVTEHRRVQESLERAKEAAEAANRAKSEFLANMSHEIRTPMTAILGFTDLLDDPDLTAAERAEFLETIRRNGKALMDLIGKILDLSKIEAEKMSLEPIACEVTPLVEDVIATLRAQAAEKGLRLEVGYVTPLPRVVETDPTRLRQILLNLIGNAIKFTDEGGVCVTVECTTGHDDASVLKFIISDTGLGIAPDKLRELFQPFTQADASTTRRFGGTGLGLAISKRLAKMLGGDIEARSQPGEGSAFTLTIRCRVP